jgi:hypothetical protein
MKKLSYLQRHALGILQSQPVLVRALGGEAAGALLQRPLFVAPLLPLRGERWWG